MDKIKAVFRAIQIALSAIGKWPIVAPVLDLLQHRSTLALIAGLIAYVLVPQIQGIPPMWRDNLGQFVFYGTLLISGRFTLEGILEAKAGLPLTTEDYLRDLLKELLNPTPDVAVMTSTAVSVAPANVVAVTTAPTPRPTLPLDEQSANG